MIADVVIFVGYIIVEAVVDGSITTGDVMHQGSPGIKLSTQQQPQDSQVPCTMPE